MTSLFTGPVAAEKAEGLQKLEAESKHLKSEARRAHKAINDRRAWEKLMLKTAFTAVEVLASAGWPTYDELCWKEPELVLVWTDQDEFLVACLTVTSLGAELLVADVSCYAIDPQVLRDFAAKHLESLLASTRRV